MLRFVFKLVFGLIGLSARLLFAFLTLAAGADGGRREPASQYQRRSSWDRRGYSWTGRPD